MTLAPYTETKRRLTPDDDDFYPSSDRKPMAATYIHVTLITETLDVLTRFFSDRDDVQVAGNNFVHYKYGDNQKHLSPDTYVVFGVTTPITTSYYTWKDGNHAPDVVFEFTSQGTKDEAKYSKRGIYERVLCVGEYFQFDPTCDYLTPSLQGFRLINGRYAAIEPVNGRLHSEFLGLDVAAEGVTLRFYDPITGMKLPNSLENEELLKEETRRADEFALRNAELVAELERLRAQLCE